MEYSINVKYTGKWHSNEKDGFGVLVDSNSGEEYEGEFVAGKRHGKGVCKYADGERYIGNWEEDVRSGLGTLEMADGNRYEGSWKGGVKDGWGTMSWIATGEVY